jgi:hypothetical protein
MLAKRLQSKHYLKIGVFWVFVWYTTFPYPYLAIYNHVLVSCMTIFNGIIPITSSYLLFLWLLPHNQNNMTCYYVSVCILKLKIFDIYNMPLAFTTPSGILLLLMHLNNTILGIIRIQSGKFSNEFPFDNYATQFQKRNTYLHRNH